MVPVGVTRSVVPEVGDCTPVMEAQAGQSRQANNVEACPICEALFPESRAYW